MICIEQLVVLTDACRPTSTVSLLSTRNKRTRRKINRKKIKEILTQKGTQWKTNSGAKYYLNCDYIVVAE